MIVSIGIVDLPLQEMYSNLLSVLFELHVTQILVNSSRTQNCQYVYIYLLSLEQHTVVYQHLNLLYFVVYMFSILLSSCKTQTGDLQLSRLFAYLIYIENKKTHDCKHLYVFCIVYTLQIYFYNYASRNIPQVLDIILQSQFSRTSGSFQNRRYDKYCSVL